MFRSLIHFELIFLKIQGEIGSTFILFHVALGLVAIPFIEETVFSPLSYFGLCLFLCFIRNHVVVCVLFL
jgi:hypothetical protein